MSDDRPGFGRAHTDPTGPADAFGQLVRLHQQALRARLMKLVDTTRRPAHARLFLTSPHPRWQNRHPIESCVDDASFEKLRQAMVEAAR